MAAMVLVDILAAGDTIVKTIDPPTATAQKAPPAVTVNCPRHWTGLTNISSGI